MGLKIASLFFSFLLWLVVNNVNDPTINRSFSNIPVKLLNTELITDSGQVYEVVDDTATISKVTVWAPRSVISSLTASNIVATADVSELSSLDTISIQLSTNVNSGEVERIEGSSDTVKLNIENKKSKTLALKATTSGDVTDGYIIGEVTTDQNLVRISGPESIISEVSKAVVDVPVTGFTSDISDNAEIKLYDADDNLITDERIVQNISTVGVQVAVYKTQDVPLVFNYTGECADGYLVDGAAEGSVNSVTLAGKESVLSSISSIELPAELVDITGQRSDYTVEVNIEDYLPGGVTLADGSSKTVQITVKISAEVTKELTVNGAYISVTNVPDGWTASIGDIDTVTLILKGLSEDVAGLRASDMRGTIDVGDWLDEQDMTEPVSGYYQVEVDFGLSDTVTVEDPVVLTLHLSKGDS